MGHLIDLGLGLGWPAYQLSFILGPRASSPALPWLDHPVCPPARGVTSSPVLIPMGDSPASTPPESTQLRWGPGPTLTSAKAFKGQDQFFRFSPVAKGWVGAGKASLLRPCHCMADEGQGHLCHAHGLQSGSPVPPSIGSALLWSPGKVQQGLLSQVLKMVRGRTNSLTCHRWQGARDEGNYIFMIDLRKELSAVWACNLNKGQSSIFQ